MLGWIESNQTSLSFLGPEMYLAAGACLVLLLGAFTKLQKTTATVISLSILLIYALSAYQLNETVGSQKLVLFSQLIVLDDLAIFF